MTTPQSMSDATPLRAVLGMRGGDLRPVALAPVLRLLQDAGLALWRDTDEARQFIEQAAALLRAEPIAGGCDIGMGSSPTPCRLAPWQIARVTGFIEANLVKRISVARLAALARLSVSYFSRAFRSTVGLSPHAYLIRRRVEHAQEMIRSTSKPLSQVALDCGMADQAHLSRHFRRVVGLSPGAWRRLYGAPESCECRPAADGGAQRLARSIAA